MPSYVVKSPLLLEPGAWHPLIEHFETNIGSMFSLKQTLGSEAFHVQVVKEITPPTKTTNLIKFFSNVFYAKIGV